MAETGRIQISGVILCEDIRYEQGGKHSLMGVATGALVWSKLDVLPLQIGFATVSRTITPGLVNLRIKLSGSALEQGVNAAAQIDATEMGPNEWNVTPGFVALLPLNNEHFKTNREGAIEFRIQQNEETEWTLVRTLSVKYKPEKAPEQN